MKKTFRKEQQRAWQKENITTVTGSHVRKPWVYQDPNCLDYVTVLPSDFLTCPKGQKYHFCARYTSIPLYIPAALISHRSKCNVPKADFDAVMHGRKPPTKLRRVK